MEEFDDERPRGGVRLRQSNAQGRKFSGIIRRRRGRNRYGGSAARMDVVMMARAIRIFMVVVGIPVRMAALSRSRVSEAGMMIMIRHGLRKFLPRRGAGREDRR